MAGIRPKVMLDDPMTRTTGTSSSTEPSMTTQEKHPLAEAGQQATETAGRLAERAADVGLRQADRGREKAAEGIDHVARGIRRFSSDLEVEQPAMADAASTAADQAERVARYLRNNDAREIISKVEGAARKQPLLFLGGAFVLGVAISRFIKAAATGSNGGSERPIGQSMNRSEDPNAYRATGPGSSAGPEGA
jgi:hypothetical protein